MGYLKHHLNLISMIGSCTQGFNESGQMFLVLEYCQHGDLKKFLERLGLVNYVTRQMRFQRPLHWLPVNPARARANIFTREFLDNFLDVSFLDNLRELV